MTESDLDAVPPMPAAIGALRDCGGPVWVFAYGSLLWDAEFREFAWQPALLRGYHRRFCIYSYDYRGTPEQPGLTLGLDRGGSCRGAAAPLPADKLDQVWRREMSGRQVYAARLLQVGTRSRTLKALAFTALRDCPDYAGYLPVDRAACLILRAAGRRGTCREYFEKTVRHLEELGLVDPALRRLAERVDAFASPAACGET